MNSAAPGLPDWYRAVILLVAGLIVAYGIYALYAAATGWSALPSNLIVILYFLLVLIVAPALAAWAFALAWQDRNLQLATILTAIPAAILLLRAVFVGGL
ncbi:MAG TPA: hypothetical protein VFY21_03470 [Xanthobacteraceae bacterium]|nr:hypothetical protein [Xanthobacteraceae bacterium]